MNAVSGAPVHWDPYDPKWLKDAEFQGQKAPAGRSICFLVAAANRDGETLPAYTPKAKASGRPNFKGERIAG